MAHHGNEGSVKVSTNAVAEVQNWEYTEEDINVAPKSSLGDTEETYLASGIIKGSGKITCLWDETDSNGQGALVAGATVVLNLYNEGETSGDTYRTGNAVVESIVETVEKEGIQMVTFNFKGRLASSTVA